MSKVLITGITGQDGAFLARKLVSEGHEVFGSVRRGSTPKTERLVHLGILNDVNIVSLEMTEYQNVQSVLDAVRPEYIYNLAADSFVHDSFLHPQYTALVNYTGVINMLEAVRVLKLDARVFQASTSDMFGNVSIAPQSEDTPFSPISPYGVSKLAAHHMVANYRNGIGMHVCSAIMYNHESELRGRQFVTRKISSWLARIVAGYDKPIPLGNLDAARDWGYAPEFVDAMVLMLEADVPCDYVIATNTLTTVRDFLGWCCAEAGFDVEFVGEGVEEVCLDRKTGKKIAVVDPKYFRKIDARQLQGDFGKLAGDLGWAPKVTASRLAEIMTRHDINVFENGSEHGVW